MAKMTAKNADRVLGKLSEQVKDKSMQKRLLEALNAMLDELADEDFFGTEGQLDPRGDQRG